MERTTNMDTNESENHPPSSKRAGSKDDYRALLDSTEQNQQHEFVKRTPFGVVSATKPQNSLLLHVASCLPLHTCISIDLSAYLRWLCWSIAGMACWSACTDWYQWPGCVAWDSREGRGMQVEKLALFLLVHVQVLKISVKINDVTCRQHLIHRHWLS